MLTAQERMPFTAPLTDWERSYLRDLILRAQGVHIKNGMRHRLDFEKEVEEVLAEYRSNAAKERHARNNRAYRARQKAAC